MALHVIKGFGPPTGITPVETGMHYVDQTDRTFYFSVGTSSPADWVLAGGQSTAFGTFLSLLDTPDTYAGASGNVLVVDYGESKVKFALPNLSDLADVVKAEQGQDKLPSYDEASKKWIPQYRMNWKGDWSSSSYTASSVVRDGRWTMIANKQTSDRAGPTPKGDPAYGIPDTATWNSKTSQPISISGYIVSFTKLASINGVRVYRPDNSINLDMSVIIYDDTDPLKPIPIQSYQVTRGAVGWVSVPWELRFVSRGSQFLIKVITSKPTAASTWTYNWKFVVGILPIAGECAIDPSGNTLYINKTDIASTNRATNLAQLAVGDTVKLTDGSNPAAYESFKVIGPYVIQGDNYAYPVSKTAVGQLITSGKTIAIQAQIATASEPAPYVDISNYWIGREPVAGASVQTYHQTVSTDPIVLEYDAVGVDLQCQEYTQSPDWDIIAVSGGTAAGGGGGGGATRFTDLTDTPQSYLGQNNRQLWVNSAGTGLEFRTPSILPHASTHAVGGTDPLSKADIGLGSVDNTSDINKPISSATQTALDAKQGTITGAASSVTTSNLPTSKVLTSDANGKIEASSVTSNELSQLSGVVSPIQTQIDSKQNSITGAASSVVSANLTASKAVVSDASGKLSSASASSTEVNYLSGVTGSIQPQIDGKQATITGAASSVTTLNLSASSALVSDAGGKIAASTVTSTELSYVSGAKSNIQTQIDNLVVGAGRPTYTIDFQNVANATKTVPINYMGGIIKCTNVAGTNSTLVLPDPTLAAVIGKETSIVLGAFTGTETFLRVQEPINEIIWLKKLDDSISICSFGSSYRRISVDVAPQIYTYSTNQTAWPKPPGARYLNVELIGGGASGYVGTVGGNFARYGGQGGCGGGYSQKWFDATLITATVPITIGAGGQAAASTVTDLQGTCGYPGGDTSFGTYLKATGAIIYGTPGAAILYPNVSGLNITPTTYFRRFQGKGTVFGGDAGYGAATPNVPIDGEGIYTGGGGGGGSLTNVGVGTIGGVGGNGGGSVSGKVFAGGTPGNSVLATSTGGAGYSHATNFPDGFFGGGGGGGGGTVNPGTGLVNVGGNGGWPGGGGGGSGARNGQQTSRSGAGASGAVYITVRY